MFVVSTDDLCGVSTQLKAVTQLALFRPPPPPALRMVVAIVQQAETGRSFPLGCEAASSVGQLQQALEVPTGVPAAQQILLLDGMKLEQERTLGEYGLPVRDPRDRPVFLFSRH